MNENSAIIGREIFDKDMNASDKEILRILKVFEENAKVADSNREQYRGKFIAVWGHKVIGADPDFNSLLRELDGKGKDPETYIGYIQKREEIFL
jgi:hypothetical protein